MTDEKMIEIPEWLIRKLIEVLVFDLEEARYLLKLKEREQETS